MIMFVILMLSLLVAATTVATGLHQAPALKTLGEKNQVRKKTLVIAHMHHYLNLNCYVLHIARFMMYIEHQ